MMFFPSFFVGDSEIVLGTCPACAGRRRPHTYAEGCKNKKGSVVPGASAPAAVPLVPVVYPDRVLAASPPEGDGHHPGATSSDDPRPPGLESPLGVFFDVSAPRERPGESLQKKPKELSSAMLKAILA